MRLRYKIVQVNINTGYTKIVVTAKFRKGERNRIVNPDAMLLTVCDRIKTLIAKRRRDRT